ncbi:transcription initiation factor IIE, alpha subunit, putative [Plasmodium ovale wallikeri]|uniref:Transcription initiation factor IIE, alpha subunit, putative n=1 Tax=Plasmodium ovale wallikeri TaxID=864142 RepID=A0A1A8YJV4_PLAOA|nr:transcription initiation factor IIE, alpha subunit, putative [Plasmodium ovale wallikeri]
MEQSKEIFYDKEKKFFLHLMIYVSRFFMSDEEIVIFDLFIYNECLYLEKDIISSINMNEVKIRGILSKLLKDKFIIQVQKYKNNEKGSTHQTYYCLNNYIVYVIDFRIKQMENELQKKKSESDIYICKFCNVTYSQLDAQLLPLDSYDAHFLCFCNHKIELIVSFFFFFFFPPPSPPLRGAQIMRKHLPSVENPGECKPCGCFQIRLFSIFRRRKKKKRKTCLIHHVFVYPPSVNMKTHKRGHSFTGDPQAKLALNSLWLCENFPCVTVTATTISTRSQEKDDSSNEKIYSKYTKYLNILKEHIEKLKNYFIPLYTEKFNRKNVNVSSSFVTDVSSDESITNDSSEVSLTNNSSLLSHSRGKRQKPRNTRLHGGYVPTCVYAYMRICAFAHLHICAFAYLRICTFACLRKRFRSPLLTCMYTHLFTHDPTFPNKDPLNKVVENGKRKKEETYADTCSSVIRKDKKIKICMNVQGKNNLKKNSNHNGVMKVPNMVNEEKGEKGNNKNKEKGRNGDLHEQYNNPKKVTTGEPEMPLFFISKFNKEFPLIGIKCALEGGVNLHRDIPTHACTGIQRNPPPIAHFAVGVYPICNCAGSYFATALDTLFVTALDPILQLHYT